MPAKISIEDVNGLDKGEFVARFGPLYEHSPWVAETAWSALPFASPDELHATMVGMVAAAPENLKMDLIRAHPDLAGKAAMSGELTPESEGEQASASLDRLSHAEFERFTRVNETYRVKFEMPMIVAVREHGSKESILAEAEARLENSHVEEVETALAEISKIARFRLRDLIQDRP